MTYEVVFLNRHKYTMKHTCPLALTAFVISLTPVFFRQSLPPLVSQQPPIAQAGLKLTMQPKMALRLQTQVAMSGYVVLLLSFNDTLVDQ